MSSGDERAEHLAKEAEQEAQRVDYFARAKEAEQEAEQAQDLSSRDAWLKIALHYRGLARETYRKS